MRALQRGVGAVAAGILVVVGLPLGASAQAEPTPAPASHGLALVDDRTLTGDGRLHELTFDSAAMGRSVKARVLLPSGYDEPDAAGVLYPTLLLLHGADGDQSDWTDNSDLVAHTADRDLIVVMPEGGARGFYSDWLDGPQWETHHLEELVPWADATYRTLGTRAGRAVAGLSMGGFGAMAYAARHPDRFVAAGSFSGAVDLADGGLAEAAALQALGVADDRRWGPFLTHEALWRGHNPPDLAPNLRWTRLALRTGNGVPCPGDNAASAVLELGVAGMTAGFATRLAVAGIAHELYVGPCGTHEWHHWDGDVAAWLPSLMTTFADPPPDPVAFDLRSTEAVTQAWGWTFTARRPAIEFLDLRAVSPAGLTATGSGPVDVVTPPRYEPGGAYALATVGAGVVTVPVALVPPLATLPAADPSRTTALADEGGRLRFTLDLGPAHTANQYSPDGIAAEALAPGSYFRTATVSIVAARAAAPSTTSTTAVSAGPPASTGTLPATGGSPPWPAPALGVAAAASLAAVRRLREHGRG